MILRNIRKLNNKQILSSTFGINCYSHSMMSIFPLYMFSQDKDKQDKNNNKDTQVKKPKVIQISKQQYQQMRSFLQTIKQSMPTPFPSMNPFTMPKSTPAPKTEIKDPFAPQLKDQSTTSLEQPQQYFSSQQHKLSFKLLKLQNPQQFLPIFQEYMGKGKSGILVMILMRYCAVGGQLNNTTSQTTKLAYACMQELITNIGKLKQYQLQQLLQLYLSLHKQSASSSSLPYLNLSTRSVMLAKSTSSASYSAPSSSFDSLLTIQQPSHTNAKVLVLMLRFWQIQVNHNQKGNIEKGIQREGVQTILKSYQLHNQSQTPPQLSQNPRYNLTQLSYISIQSLLHNIPSTSLNILLHDLSSTNTALNKNVVHSLQIIVENCNNKGIQMKQKFEEIVGKYGKLLEEWRMKGGDGVMGEGQDRGVEGIDVGTGEMSALLHTCLLSITQSPNSWTSKILAQKILPSILLNPKQSSRQLSLPQYNQYWKSCMIIYKLLKLPSYKTLNHLHSTINYHNLYNILNTFISKTENIQIWLKDIIVSQSGAVVQEIAIQGQRMIFECLVAYRMVINAEIGNPDKWDRINQETNGNIEAKRRVLKQLLNGYKRVIQTLYKTTLFDRSHLHNLIIVCMIAEAYPYLQGKTYQKYFLSEQILQILQEEGSYHEKYGNYVKKIIKNRQF